MALATISNRNKYVNKFVDNARGSGGLGSPSRLAALGASAIKGTGKGSSAAYEYSGGFRLPKVPALPGDQNDNSKPMTAQPLTADLVSRNNDPDLQISLRLPGLSAEEWQEVTGQRRARNAETGKKRGKAATTRLAIEAPLAAEVDAPIDAAYLEQSNALPASTRGEIADDDTLKKMQKMAMNVKTGTRTSADDAAVNGIGLLQSLSEKHRNMLVMDLLKQYDTDRSGCFEMKELLPVMQAVTDELYPKKQMVITEDDTDFVMKTADNSGDGKLDHGEFMKALEFWDYFCDKKKEIDMVINRYDVDMSGELEEAEFEVLLQDLAKMNNFTPPGPDEANTMFHMADMNKNGKIEKVELSHAMASYLQAKQQQALGNVYHPNLHDWIRKQVEYIFYFVPNHDWHGEVYNEIVKMKPWRKLYKYLEEVIPSALKLTKHPNKAKAQLQTQVETMISKFCKELENNQRYENENNPWIYMPVEGEDGMDFWDESDKKGKRDRSKDKGGKQKAIKA